VLQAQQSPKYLVVKGSGGAGLGDKLRALAVGMLLARATGRVLWVDWADRAYAGEGTNIFPHLFSLSGIECTAECPAAESVAPNVWSGHLEKSQDAMRAHDLRERGVEWNGPAPPWDPIEAMRRYSWSVEDLHDPAQAVVVTTMLSVTQAASALRLEGLIDPRADAEVLLARCLREHLRSSVRVGELIAGFAEQNGFRKRRVVGIHVRHAEESAAARTMPSMEAYFAAAEKAMGPQHESVLFLATDNSSVIDWFRARFGEGRVLVTPKWFAAPGQSLHKNPLCPDPIASAQEAVVDLGLLACCDHLVSLGNSSFSIVASALSRAPESERTVLLPRQSMLRRTSSRVRSLLGRSN
jgi:hypothetical protein